MPLNMNTIGIGNGGDNCTEEIFDMSYELSSKVKILDIKSITPNGSVYSKTGTEHYYTESINTCADAVDGAAVFARYNGELYGSLNQRCQTFCKIHINDNIDTSKITCTYTKISTPFIYFCEALVVDKYMYIVGNSSTSLSPSTSEYANDALYRFDGLSFTKIPTTDFYAGSASKGLHLYRIPKSSDGNTYVLVTNMWAGSPMSTYIGLLKLNSSGNFEKVIGFNDVNLEQYGYKYIYPTNIRGSAEQFHYDLCTGSSLAFPISIEVSNTSINIYFGHIYREVEDNRYTVRQYKCVYMITFDLRQTPHPMSFTTVSSYNEISHISFTSTTCPSYYDGIFEAYIYPLDHLLYDTYILMINNGYARSGTQLLNYIVSTTPKDITIKSITGKLISDNSINSLLHATGLYIDLDSEYPAYHYAVYSTRDDDNYYRFTRYMQHITVDGTQDSTGSTCTFNIYCQKGDKCMCNAGIISYTYNGSTVHVNNTTVSITADGNYTFITHTYDAYHAPEFIVKSKSGNILGTRCTYNNGTLIGYFAAGMTVNDNKITENGYNKITVNKPRINIQM